MNFRDRLTIIIPALDEEEQLPRCLESAAPLGGEMIVVDGGSKDRTGEIALEHGARLLAALRGRGIQLRAGAEAASGTWLLFLHADSRLTPRAYDALATAIDTPDFRIGTFRLQFDLNRPLYRLYSWLSRVDSIWTSFGDQGILIHAGFYRELGGFPAWPLLEDVALLQRARRVATIHSLPAAVETSARRFEQRGIARQQLRNGIILLRYLLGSSPETLARAYSGTSLPGPFSGRTALRRRRLAGPVSSNLSSGGGSDRDRWHIT